MFQGKNILLGMGGGIAVYRVAELARLFIKQGANVRCVMTTSACEFVTPLTFEALTGEAVHTDLFDLTSERAMGHIQLVRWADVVIIAPATANLIAKLAHGIADDLLSTMMQVCEASVLLAPAMNTSMWKSLATQRNVQTLKDDGINILEPAAGELACGEFGAGRLPEPQVIADATLPLLLPQALQGQHWVVNAGPTLEPWDAVRVLSNRASGTLGARLAQYAAAMGADVSLIAGVGTPSFGCGVQRVDVQTCDEMLQACEEAAQHADVFIGTAAVSDFRFSEMSEQKIKRGDTQQLNVQLTANTDIIASIAAMPKRPKKVIAFAAESENHVAYAKAKLERKGVDAIVANDVNNMASDSASGWWICHRENGINEEIIEKCNKMQFSQEIIKKVMELVP
ncbi:MAG: bifunctional phosphopantothenoylcysteine decarboxylase/phosphopantothenate--cysteine ligase CoaBC [Proteobacteria bacterium]|nr:MAG: bifunctional phosphopantothenoylcysteine decarboxylase/phosphopantothenate--cysteine ligase CoaBC [Pseudomonadota bacterium]